MVLCWGDGKQKKKKRGGWRVRASRGTEGSNKAQVNWGRPLRKKKRGTKNGGKKDRERRLWRGEKKKNLYRREGEATVSRENHKVWPVRRARRGDLINERGGGTFPKNPETADA